MKDPRQAHSYKGLHPLGRTVTFLLALGIVAAAVDLGHDIHLLVLLDAVIGERSREAVLDMAAAFELGDRILFPTLGIVAVTAVAFLAMGLPRQCERPCARLRGPEIPAGWAVGWWFVPIANLIQVPRVMLELYRVALAGDPAARRGHVGSAPVIVWWLLILFANGADRYGAGRIGSGEGFEPLRQALIAYIAGDVMFLVAAGLAIWLVRRIPPASKARKRRPTGRSGRQRAGARETPEFVGP